MSNEHQQIQDFQDLISTLATTQEIACDRREETRICRSLSLVIQPLNENFHPVGDPFWALSRDINQQGLGFVNPDPVDHDFVRISICSYQATVVARVCHSTSLGLYYPLYLVGVEFVTDK